VSFKMCVSTVVLNVSFVYPPFLFLPTTSPPVKTSKVKSNKKERPSGWIIEAKKTHLLFVKFLDRWLLINKQVWIKPAGEAVSFKMCVSTVVLNVSFVYPPFLFLPTTSPPVKTSKVKSNRKERPPCWIGVNQTEKNVPLVGFCWLKFFCVLPIYNNGFIIRSNNTLGK
jgi:hypothetical protein